MNEEESRDRKQSGTEGKERRIKTRREGTGTSWEEKERREGDGDEEDETRSDCAKRRSSSRCLPREQKKKKERSKVRASGPDTDRFSRDTDEEEEGIWRKEDKRIYLPVQARISASSKISVRGQIVSTALIHPPKECYLIISLRCESVEKSLRKRTFEDTCVVKNEQMKMRELCKIYNFFLKTIFFNLSLNKEKYTERFSRFALLRESVRSWNLCKRRHFWRT